MKKVVVIPVKTADEIDDKQTDKIELPIGETVVGRGEKFKVTLILLMISIKKKGYLL